MDNSVFFPEVLKRYKMKNTVANALHVQYTRRTSTFLI
jgi:hypothetical protein